jgi:3-oxoacyl-[acyl-carrier-protein] synthase-3
MIGGRIAKIEVFLPARILDNKQLEREFKDWSAKKIEDKTGIRERHITDENETALDLAFKAGEKLLHSIDSKSIDFLLLCTQSPDYYLPAGSCILQDRLGLSQSIGALDFNLGCSGYVYGLVMARGLIQSGIARNILFITADTYSKHMHPKDRTNRTIFGDGAAATWICVSEENAILDSLLGTDGSGYQNLIVPTGGIRKRYNPDASEFKDSSGSVRTENHLAMNGPEIFNFTIEKIPAIVENCLKKNNLTLNDLRYVIFHQANKYILDYLRKKVNIPEEKYYINMLNVGNTVSCSIPIALKDCLDRDVLKAGDLVLLVGFGVGYSWGAVILEI